MLGGSGTLEKKETANSGGRPLIYFWGGILIGVWGTVLTTLTLPSEAILLSVSRTRKNFSASMASLRCRLICGNIITAS
jgi:hypothetical protein